MAPDFRAEFPTYPAESLPVIPEGFTDASWHNDACPSFINEAAKLHLFVDWPDAAEREMPGSLRFTLAHMDDECTGDTITHTDDWAEILKAIADHTTAPKGR